MKEILQLRLNNEFAHLLVDADEGIKLGSSIRLVNISRDDPRYVKIPIIKEQLKKQYDEALFFGWEIKRKYTKAEFDTAKLFRVIIKCAFEPAGEECGTVYDEASACNICGANRTQIGVLKLKSNSIPKKDIARTIGGEVVVSRLFYLNFKKWSLTGLEFGSVHYKNSISNYNQLIASERLNLSDLTVAGINPFDLSTSSEGTEFVVSDTYKVKLESEIYRCPKGHTIGLNPLSEAYVYFKNSINTSDFFSSTQLLGVRRGLLNPKPLYFCSPAFRKMVLETKMRGFDFEITRGGKWNVKLDKY